MRKYPTDLTDSQYNAILSIICDTRKRQRSLKEVFDAIFYLLKSGCQWRMLPSDLPKCERVYYYFRKWSRDGTLEEVHEILRKRLRKKRGLAESPSYCSIDSQSIKTFIRLVWRLSKTRKGLRINRRIIRKHDLPRFYCNDD